jgi:hypothetical protein
MPEVFMPRRRAAVAGLTVTALGAVALWHALGYDAGSLRQIGPAVFPAGLGLLMLCLGLLIVLSDMTRVKPGDVPRSIPWRGLLFILGAMAAFAFLLERAGLVPAVAAAVLLSACADRKMTWIAAVLLAAGLSAGCSLVFIRFLKLPLQMLITP